MRCNYFYVEKSDTAEKKLFFYWLPFDYINIDLFFFFELSVSEVLQTDVFILFFSVFSWEIDELFCNFFNDTTITRWIPIKRSRQFARWWKI